MNRIFKIIITEKREVGGVRKTLSTKRQFTLLFVGSPKKDEPTLSWIEKEEGGFAPRFGKVLFRQYKNGRCRIKKGKTFYFSSKSGAEGEYKEIHPEER